jgi:predicted DNA-binding transcriptional regulator AlpA
MQTDTNVATATNNTQSPARAALCALPDILARGKFSKSHLYNLMARRHFPEPCLRMGPRFTRWSAEQVDQWFQDPAAWIAANAGGPTA